VTHKHQSVDELTSSYWWQAIVLGTASEQWFYRFVV